MTKSAKHSALLVAGAAAAVAATATYIGRRRLRVVKTPNHELSAPRRAELPVGRSADPELDELVPSTGIPADVPVEAGLDEIWNSLPGFAEGEQTEGYDAVAPEDMGAVWLERATQTTHEERPHASDPNDVPDLEDLLVTDAVLRSSRVDEDEGESEDDYDNEDEDEEQKLDDDEQ